MAPPAFAVPAGPKNIPPHRWRACWPKKYFPAPLACLLAQKIFSRTAGVPAMQAPTRKKQGLCKNSIALSKFHRRGEHCSPALAAAATPKIFPRTVAGLQCRPLQAIGKAYAKILSPFLNFIVGASIARPPKPCGITRPPGGAEPHPYHKPQENAFKFYRYFAIPP